MPCASNRRPALRPGRLGTPRLRRWLTVFSAGVVAIVVTSCGEDATAPDDSNLRVPEGVSAEPLDISTVRLDWIPVGEDGVVAYRIERRVNLTGAFERYRDVRVDEVEVTDSLARFEDEGLAPETFYGYRIRSVGFLGGVSGPSVVGGARTPPPPSIRLVTVTSGPTPESKDTDGYTVDVVGPESRNVNLPSDGTILLKNLAPGSYSVSLSGVAENCSASPTTTTTTVMAEGLQTVSEVRFNVSCKDPTRGEIRARVVTRGAFLPDSANLVVVNGITSEGEAVSFERPLSPNRDPGGEVTFINLIPGSYEVKLHGVDPRCEVVGESVVSGIEVGALTVDTVRFEVLCGDEGTGGDGNLLARWLDASGAPIQAAAPGDRVRLQVCSTEDLEFIQGALFFSPSLLTFVAALPLDAGAASGVHPDCRGTTDYLDDSFLVNPSTNSVNFLVVRVETQPNVGTVGVGDFVFDVTAEGAEFVTFEQLRGNATGEQPVDFVTDASRLLIDPDSVGTNQPPVADAGGPYATVEGDPLQLDGTASSDPENGDLAFDWDFGDGTTADDGGPTPTHTWTSAGTFTVTLTVRDARGATDQATASVTVATVSGNTPPVADAGGPYSIEVGRSLLLDGSASADADGSIVQYDWDYGDGINEEGVGPDPSHTYTSTGTFTVTLTVTDDAGSTAQATAEVTVRAPAADGNVLVRWVDASGAPVSWIEPGQTVRAHICSTEGALENVQATLDWDGDGGGELSFRSARDLDSDGDGVFGPLPDDQQPHPDCAASDFSGGAEDLLKDQFQAFVPDTLVTEVNLLNQRNSISDESASPVGIFDIAFTAEVEGRVDEDDLVWSFAIFNGTLGAVIAPVVDTRPLFVSTTAVSDPLADAGGPYTGSVGGPVQFSGSGSDPDGGSVTFDWDFGDGTVASGSAAEVTHTYASPGTHTVVLTVTDDEGVSVTATTTATIGSSGEPPIADAGGPYSATQGISVQLDASGSSDPDGGGLTFDWDFGDGSGQQGAGPTPSHTYSTTGTFTVSVTVTDDNGGGSATGQADVVVSPPEDPFALRTRWPVDSVFSGDVVMVEVSSNPGSPLRQVLAELNLNTTFLRYDSIESAGFGALRADDSRASVGEVSIQATAESAAPAGVVSRIARVYFTALPQEGVTGLLSAGLVLRDGSLTNISMGSLPVQDEPLYVEIPNAPPVAEAGGPYAGGEGGPVAFDGGGSADSDGSIVEYVWDFLADGLPPDTGVAVEAIFPTAGSYDVVLTVLDDEGASDADTTTVEIVPNEPPTARANGPYSAVAGESIAFTASGSSDGDGTIVSYAWDFGDGSTGTGPAPVHAYQASGTYDVVLTLRDDIGATASDSTVADIELPTEFAVRNVWTNLSVTSASGPALAGSSVEGSTSYAGPGDEVELVLTTRPGTGASVGRFTAEVGWDPGLLRLDAFEGGSTWEMLDALEDTVGTGTDFVVFDGRTTVPESGDQAVLLARLRFTVVAIEGQATASMTSGVALFDGTGSEFGGDLPVIESDLEIVEGSGSGNLSPTASAGGPYAAGIGDTIVFSGSGSDSDGVVVRYDWDFGDGVRLVDVGATPAHSYGTSGTFVATITVFDEFGATGTASADVAIAGESGGPVALIQGPDTVTVGDTVTFDGSGSTDPDGPIASYAWSFADDGSTATGVTASHVFGTAGSFVVELTVADTSGLTGSTTKEVLVEEEPVNAPPQAVLTAPTTSLLKMGREVTFSGSGSTDPDGTVASYAWSFSDDGSTITGETVNHLFPIEPDTSQYGVVVELTVTDDAGASSTTTDTLLVKENLPPEAFIDGPASVTVGQVGTFVATRSTDRDLDRDGGLTDRRDWVFSDDGATPAGDTVTHVFNSVGTFQVTLTVEDGDGAVASDTVSVEVGQPNVLVRWVALDGTPITAAAVGDQVRAHVCTTNGTVQNFMGALDYDAGGSGVLSYSLAQDLDSDGNGPFGPNPSNAQPHPDCLATDTALGTDDLLDDQFQANQVAASQVAFLNQRTESTQENAAPVGILDILFTVEVAGVIDASDFSFLETGLALDGTGDPGVPITPFFDVQTLTAN